MNNQPPIPSPTQSQLDPQPPQPPQPASDLLTCPYCARQFPFTWRSYWFQGFNSLVKCPHCARKAQLQWTKAYLLWVLGLAVAHIVLQVAVMMVTLLLGYSWQTATSLPRIVEIGVLTFCIGVVQDKSMDARRPLQKIKGQ